MRACVRTRAHAHFGHVRVGAPSEDVLSPSRNHAREGPWHLCVCVCVCVRACAGGRAGVRVCTHACVCRSQLGEGDSRKGSATRHYGRVSLRTGKPRDLVVYRRVSRAIAYIAPQVRALAVGEARTEVAWLDHGLHTPLSATACWRYGDGSWR